MSWFDKIFQSLTQVDGSKSRKFNGIGVGLAITKYLQDFMGGTKGIESEDGKGSLF
jgi:signal transduction histidine kinase